MKSGLLLTSCLFALFSTSTFAACYTFSSSDGISVCLKGDSFDDRKAASELCKKNKGSDCGNITAYSSSCSGKCLDASGTMSNSLSGF
ncbi:MAG: hypothetical protein IJ566_01205 [Cardiobacteriaceae bacterium]|nr:hypothetical protein [Cardiobacteriaceae bacterium]